MRKFWYRPISIRGFYYCQSISYSNILTCRKVPVRTQMTYYTKYEIHRYMKNNLLTQCLTNYIPFELHTLLVYVKECPKLTQNTEKPCWTLVKKKELYIRKWIITIPYCKSVSWQPLTFFLFSVNISQYDSFHYTSSTQAEAEETIFVIKLGVRMYFFQNWCRRRKICLAYIPILQPTWI